MELLAYTVDVLIKVAVDMGWCREVEMNKGYLNVVTSGMVREYLLTYEKWRNFIVEIEWKRRQVIVEIIPAYVWCKFLN